MRNPLFRTIGPVLTLAAGLAAAAHAQAQVLDAELVTSGLSLPLYATHTPGDTSRLFIVQQRGLIRILDLNTNLILPVPFIDLTALVSASGNERGLLGLAFHPDYEKNGYFFVNYTGRTDGDTYIARYQVTADPNVADPNSRLQVHFIDQPFSNHNGGWLGFSPNDGYLYIAMGDGGSQNDPGNRAQTITNQHLGKMLRVDINGDDFPADPLKNYAIPASNPFVGATGDDEIWAFGLRNPWRDSFDRDTGDLYIADVGQNNVEEVNFQPASSAGGVNYGWRCMEGTSCTGLTGCTCNDIALTLPIHEYTHAEGCSVTGGYIYRGSRIPHLRGTYFLADFCSDLIWSFRYDGSTKSDFLDRTTELTPGDGTFINSVASFAEDAAGELYICDLGGEVFRVIALCPADLTGDGVQNTQDVLAFLNYWVSQDPAADWNLDGTINTQDVLAYLNAWNTPCE